MHLQLEDAGQAAGLGRAVAVDFAGGVGGEDDLLRGPQVRVDDAEDGRAALVGAGEVLDGGGGGGEDSADGAVFEVQGVGAVVVRRLVEGEPAFGGGVRVDIRVRCPDDGQVPQGSAGLHVLAGHPADQEGAHADPVPGGRGRILAQDVVVLGVVGRQRDQHAVVGAGTGMDVEASGLGGVGGGPGTQLRDPGDLEALQAAVRQQVVLVDPAGDGVAEADLVPGGEVGVLAQQFVADGGAAGNGGDPGMCLSGSEAHLEAVRDAGLEAGPGPRGGDGQVAAVAVQAHAGGGDPAGDGVAEADLVPGSRVGVPLQDRMEVGAAGRDHGHLGGGRGRTQPDDTGLCGVGQTDLGRRGQIEVALGLDRVVRPHPAADGVVVLDVPPAGMGRVPAQQAVPGRAAGRDRGELGLVGRASAIHRHTAGVPGPEMQPGWGGVQAVRVVCRHLVGPHPAPARIRELQLVPGVPVRRRDPLEDPPDPGGAGKDAGGRGPAVREDARPHCLVPPGRGPRRGVRGLRHLGGDVVFGIVGIVGKDLCVLVRQVALDVHHIPAHPTPGRTIRSVVRNPVPEIVPGGGVAGQVHDGHPTIDVEGDKVIVDLIQFAFRIAVVLLRLFPHFDSFGVQESRQVRRRGRRGQRYFP